MTKRKGEITDKHRNQSHPYQVALDKTPGPGAYAIMYRWAAWFAYVTTSNGMDGMHWCFCHPEVADAFAMDFGGRRVDRPIDPSRLAIDQPNRRELERRASASLSGLELLMGGRPLDTKGLFKEAAKIPFSSFRDPTDVARAQGALDKAWAEVVSSVPEEQHELERTRLAYLIASYALVAEDDDELARRAVDRFRQR